MPRKFYLAAFLICLFVATVRAQEGVVNYGSMDDLKGVTKVFVYTGSEMEVRENITKEIRKRIPTIEFVNKPEQAEVWLVFGATINTFKTGTTTNANVYGTSNGAAGSATTQDNYQTVVNGSGQILRNRDGEQALVWKFDDGRTSPLERRPSTNFARKFVELYEKVNGKQKK